MTDCYLQACYVVIMDAPCHEDRVLKELLFGLHVELISVTYLQLYDLCLFRYQLCVWQYSEFVN